MIADSHHRRPGHRPMPTAAQQSQSKQDPPPDQKRPQQRLEEKLTADKSTRTARRDRVVKSILHSIFNAEVAGGDRLVEEELALKLGVSRTPIREALRELSAIGVIWLKPNHGAMVRPFGPVQLREIYHIRRIL